MRERERAEVRRDESDEEFKFGMIEEAEDGCRGSGQNNEPEPAEQEESRVEKGKLGGRAKKGRVDLNKKARTRTWLDVVRKKTN